MPAAIAFLSPRDNIVIDAGANRGDWTINLLQAAYGNYMAARDGPGSDPKLRP